MTPDLTGKAAPIRDFSSIPKWGRWTHVKSGGVYVIEGFCIAEAGLTPSVIYVAVEGHGRWVRSCEEFFDGRFERIE